MIGVGVGTTNTVVARLRADGTVATTRHRFGAREIDVVRSLLCFAPGDDPRRSLAHAVGPDAIDLHLDDPLDTRLMLSLKSDLAQASFRETRALGRAFTLDALLALILRRVPPAPGTATLAAGRPVRFVGDRGDDALGDARLRGA